jgi:hypothetical protein
MKHTSALTLTLMTFTLISCGSVENESSVLDSLTVSAFTFDTDEDNNSVMSDFVVPTSFAGLSISWQSDSDLVTYNFGSFKVAPTDRDKKVMLTATVMVDQKEVSKKFEIQLEASKIIFSGRYDNGREKKLGYWSSKNSFFNGLKTVTNSGFMSSSFVYNDKLYLAYSTDNTLGFWSEEGETLLETEAFNNTVDDIYVNSSGVFLSGSARESGNPSASNSSAFWDGSSLYHLDDTDLLGNNTGVAVGVIEKDNDILVVGHRLNGHFPRVGFWNTEDGSCLSGTCGDESWTEFDDPSLAACPNTYTRGCIIESVTKNNSNEIVALGRCQRSFSEENTCGDSIYAYRNVIFRDGKIEEFIDPDFVGEKIYTHKSDQYVLGYKQGVRGYYKNNQFTVVEAEPGYAAVSLTDIKVIGSSVYITGSQVRYDMVDQTPIYLAGYWKDGEWNALTDADDSYQRVNTIEVVRERH